MCIDFLFIGVFLEDIKVDMKGMKELLEDNNDNNNKNNNDNLLILREFLLIISTSINFPTNS